MVVLAAALAWLGSGCSSTVISSSTEDAASDAGGPLPDAARPQSDVADTSSTPTDAANTDCALGTSYTYGWNGGFVAFNAETALTPPASYRHSRTYVGIPDPPAPQSCMPALPACGDATLIDMADVIRDLADPDVVQAMAMTTPPLYGLDQRPVDGAVFQVLRADGHGFLAGGICDTGAFCHDPVPAGIARLVADLKALDQQQLADPSCASQNPSPP